MTARRWLVAAVPALAVLAAFGCRSGPHEGSSSRARTMVLTSGPSEIVLSSTRVPGYWARPVDAEDRFFLSTRDRSYKKGNRVAVEGPFSPAHPSVFREDTGEYLKTVWDRPVFVLAVWKIGRAENAPRP
jgi:hypothetical protein